MFKYKPGIGVSYVRQGSIYFASRSYREQPKKVRRKIDALCRTCAGEHWQALFEFVTTDDTATAICMRHFIGKTTLWRIVKKYYESY